MIDILEQTIIFELRHANYEKTIEVDQWCDDIWNNRNHGIYIKDKVGQQLTEKQLEKGLQIYRSQTSEALQPIKSLYERMHQSDGANVVLESESEDFTNAVNSYYQSATLSKYLQKNYVKWNFENPNAWLVTERLDVKEGERIEEIINYPLLVLAEQAINYKYDNRGNAEWLIVRQERKEKEVVKNTLVTETVEDYFMYAAGRAIAYRGYKNRKPAEGTTIRTLEVARNKKNFVVTDALTGTKHFVGCKVGALGDDVKYPPHWIAKPAIEDLIIHKFWKDCIEAKHIFPRKWQFAETCDNEHEEMGRCDGGYYGGVRHDDYLCQACGGKRIKTHKSALDVMYIPYPENVPISELPKLGDMVYYEMVEVAAVEYYDKQVDKDVARIPISIFSVQVAEAPNPLQIKTATEIESERQDTNTAVLKVAEGYSLCWEIQHTAIAEYQETEAIVKHAFAPDLKLETLGQLMNRYATAKIVPADAEIVNSLECDIVRKSNANDPMSVERFKMRRKLLPFPFQSDSEIQLIINELSNTDRDVVLHRYQHKIFTEIEEEHADFYSMSYAQQTNILNAKIEQVAGGIQFATNANNLTFFE